MDDTNTQTEEKERVDVYQAPASIANPPAIVKPAAAPTGTVAIFVWISGEVFAAKPERTPSGKIWHLRNTKTDTTCTVKRGSQGLGLECSCFEFAWAFANSDDRGCRHARALKSAAMLD